LQEFIVHVIADVAFRSTLEASAVSTAIEFVIHVFIVSLPELRFDEAFTKQYWSALLNSLEIDYQTSSWCQVGNLLV
jgi:hypothetical protein